MEQIRAYRENHKLAIRTPLPQKISMFSTKMKENLIEIISLTLMEKLRAKKSEANNNISNNI